MSFTSISVKEAIEKINATNNGWFLPYVQRSYVWGSRYESEKYICKLFDSILKGYPIGTLLVWNSSKKIPYHEFMQNYIDGQTAKQVDESLWTRPDKWLVYDGQQRLQTLYSCLKYSINERILIYNLKGAISSFINDQSGKDDEEDNDIESADKIWFEFADKNCVPQGCISIPKLFIQDEDSKTKFRNEIKREIFLDINENNEDYFEKVVDDLWDAFVRKEKKSLAYFPMDCSWKEEKVNDVFQRINMGGVPLSGADLLLSKIKQKSHDFEEKLQAKVKDIENNTAGFSIEPNTILQIMNLIVRGRLKLDAEKISTEEIKQFPVILDNVLKTIDSFYKLFVFDKFQINKNSIIPSGQALFPLILYVYNKLLKGIQFRNIDDENITRMKQFFICSQINDWRTVFIIENGCRAALNADVSFPLSEIEQLASSKGRFTGLSVKGMEGFRWFILKILTPQKVFSWGKFNGRYAPELDHIFPKKLKGMSTDFAAKVDIVWNMQPVTGEINGSKLNANPKEFFMKNKDKLKQYDYVPIDLNDSLWDDPDNFISARKEKMIKYFIETYKITPSRNDL